MNALLSIMLWVAMIHPPAVSYTDAADDVAAAIKTGNAANIAKFFSTTVNLKILDKEDIYSKAQAELILMDFFSKNVVKSFTILHKSTAKNGDQLVTGSYESSNGKKYRIYYLLKKDTTGVTVNQFRIDLANE
jgi:hypothetical protein